MWNENLCRPYGLGYDFATTRTSVPAFVAAVCALAKGRAAQPILPVFPRIVGGSRSRSHGLTCDVCLRVELPSIQGRSSLRRRLRDALTQSRVHLAPIQGTD